MYIYIYTCTCTLSAIPYSLLFTPYHTYQILHSYYYTTIPLYYYTTIPVYHYTTILLYCYTAILCIIYYSNRAYSELYTTKSYKIYPFSSILYYTFRFTISHRRHQGLVLQVQFPQFCRALLRPSSWQSLVDHGLGLGRLGFEGCCIASIAHESTKQMYVHIYIHAGIFLSVYNIVYYTHTSQQM